MLRFALLIGAVACLAACKTVALKSTFDAREASFILKKGTGRIDGQAFVRRDYGKLVTAAGERVYLIPATRYATERFDAMFDGDRRAYFGNTVDVPPNEYYDYRKEAKVDMRGRFVFEDLSPGRYIVATRVFWTEPKSYITRGGAIWDVVEVKKDETTQAVISGK